MTMKAKVSTGCHIIKYFCGVVCILGLLYFLKTLEDYTEQLAINGELQNDWSSCELPVNQWPGYDYFMNANEYHYNLNYEYLAAMAVKDYSGKKNIEHENWRIKRIYENDDVYYAFVESETGRELYLLVEEQYESDYKVNYIVAADIKKNQKSENVLGEQYSYDSTLEWYPYDIYGKYGVETRAANYVYDSIY